jgi:hypothetical protein
MRPLLPSLAVVAAFACAPGPGEVRLCAFTPDASFVDVMQQTNALTAIVAGTVTNLSAARPGIADGQCTGEVDATTLVELEGSDGARTVVGFTRRDHAGEPDDPPLGLAVGDAVEARFTRADFANQLTSLRLFGPEGLSVALGATRGPFTGGAVDDLDRLIVAQGDDDGGVWQVTSCGFLARTLLDVRMPDGTERSLREGEEAKFDNNGQTYAVRNIKATRFAVLNCTDTGTNELELSVARAEP